MTKEQAIEILQSALSNIQTTLKGHELLQKALKVLVAPPPFSEKQGNIK